MDAIEYLNSFPVENGEVTEVQRFEKVTLGQSNPLHIGVHDSGPWYKVTLSLHPTLGSNITVAVGLPEKDHWNGSFLGTGNGGPAGTIAESSVLGGVSRGYATANTDMGTSPEPYAHIGNREVIRDFGHRATHLMTTVGKALTAYFYGKEPECSIFIGGSTGGQQAFSEAQRYPEDYDGVIALSPAFDRVRLHAFFVWNWQQIHKNDAAFNKKTATRWRRALEKVYKPLCGSNADDVFLFYPGRVKDNPMEDPRLQADAKKILTEGQRRALHALYGGVPGDFIAPFLPGAENEGLSLELTSNREFFAKGFFYLFNWIWGPNFDFMSFDFEKDLQRAIEELSPELDATDPDLSAFKARGGKLLVIGGSSDAIIPYTGFLRYYREVIQCQGSVENTRDFFRFFLMPGFSHTMGGEGVQEVGMAGISAVPRDPDHDVICAMERWLKDKQAPERLLGTHLRMSLKGLQFDYARPAYAYPNITVFDGGDPKKAENYHPEENEELFQ